MRCRLDDVERIILLVEERLYEYNIIDENLLVMLVKVKLYSDVELRRFKEEVEIFYYNGVSIKNFLMLIFILFILFLVG